MAFDGFASETVAFFEGLQRDNTKSWFNSHRAGYDDHVVAPAKAFVATMAELLPQISPEIHAEPRINGSIMRINRDIRFSKDKSPDKTHLDLWFWTGNKRGWDRPGFFFRMQPPDLLLGTGMHKFDKPEFAAYREAVLDDKRAKTLRKAIAEATAGGAYALGGAGYKKVPRGMLADHPKADLLLHDGLHVSSEASIPPEFTAASFPEYCMDHFRAVAPVFHWLMALTAQT